MYVWDALYIVYIYIYIYILYNIQVRRYKVLCEIQTWPANLSSDALPTELGSFAQGWPRIGNVFVRDGNQVQKLVGGC